MCFCRKYVLTGHLNFDYEPHQTPRRKIICTVIVLNEKIGRLFRKNHIGSESYCGGKNVWEEGI